MYAQFLLLFKLIKYKKIRSISIYLLQHKYFNLLKFNSIILLIRNIEHINLKQYCNWFSAPL